MLYTGTFKLRDYQVDGIAFLDEAKRAMLLDAPGLGKTPQAAYAGQGPTLINAPAYLVPQWEDWLLGRDEKSLIRNDGLIIPNVEGKVLAAMGSRVERTRIINEPCDWLITNHEMLDGYDEFTDKKWQRRFRKGIIDESHHLKSHVGKRAKVAVKLFQPFEYVFELTATPVKREVDDLFMQLRILQPDIFTSYWQFVRHYCNTEDTYFGIKILGLKKSMAKELHQILDIVSLGRSYEDAGRELPPVIEKTVPVILNASTRRLYDEAISYWRVQDEEGKITFTNYMSVLHTLRQFLTGLLKGDVVKNIVEDNDTEGKGKTVIFSWYKETAAAIQRILGVDNCELVTGDETDKKIRRQKAEGLKHVSATISSISEGIDLSGARCVIFAEEDYTPGANYQALSRVRRDRNDEGEDLTPILVYYVQCARTVDVTIHNTSQGRAGTAKSVVKSALYL